MADPMPGSEGPAEPGPVIRDRRRLDPQTGQVRDPYGAARSGVSSKSRGRHTTGKGSKGSAGGAPAQGDDAMEVPAEPVDTTVAAVKAAEAAAAEVEAVEAAAASEAVAAADPGGEAAEPAAAEAAASADAKAGSSAAAAGAKAASAAEAKAAADEAKAAAADASGSVAADLVEARTQAEERLADLQRLQAEFLNYRKRVDRDRTLARDYAVKDVLESLLPVLDDVHLARQHGDLETGPFAAIAEKLDGILTRHGLVRYGEPGEPFDPEVHEALMHTEAELAEGTTVTTVVQVLQPGYRIRDRVLRPARVAVADPQA